MLKTDHVIKYMYLKQNSGISNIMKNIVGDWLLFSKNLRYTLIKIITGDRFFLTILKLGVANSPVGLRWALWGPYQSVN